MSTPYHPAHSFTVKDMIAFRDDQQRLGAEHRKRIAEAEKLPPVPKPPRKCRHCDRPLSELSDCSDHANQMRHYRTEFDLGTNWSEKLSGMIAEEFRLEEREQELLTVAESLKGKRDEESQGKLLKIFGRDFKSKVTEQITHQDGLLDVVRNRLAEIRKAMPVLVRSADVYLAEAKNVPTDGQIFQQRKRDERAARILQ
jgi:hypothetical protein